MWTRLKTEKTFSNCQKTYRTEPCLQFEDSSNFCHKTNIQIGLTSRPFPLPNVLFEWPLFHLYDLTKQILGKVRSKPILNPSKRNRVNILLNIRIILSSINIQLLHTHFLKFKYLRNKATECFIFHGVWLIKSIYCHSVCDQSHYGQF